MVPAQYLEGRQHKRPQRTVCGTDTARPTQSPASSPGDVQENNTLGLQVLNLGGQVSSVTLEGTNGGVCGVHEWCRGGLPPSRACPLCLPAWPAHHHSDVLGQVLGAAHQEVREGCLWETEASPFGDRDLPSPPRQGPVAWQTQVGGGRGWQTRWAWGGVLLGQQLHSHQHRTSCSESGC